MPVYVYEAEDLSGKVIKGTVDAFDEPSARLQLKDLPYPIRRVYRLSFIQEFLWLGGGISLLQIAIFTREITCMLQAGLGLARCLEVISASDINVRFRVILQRILVNLKKGASFTTAISQYSAVFPPLYLALVKAGELSGELTAMLDRLAAHFEWEYGLRGRVKSAMVYPIIVFTIAVILAIVVVLVIFPIFVDMFEGLNVQMPPLTRAMIVLVSFLTNWLTIAALIVGSISVYFLIRRYLKTSLGRYHCHWHLMHLPILGPLIQKIAIARFCRTFSTMYGSGLSLLTIMEVISGTTGNEVFNERLRQCIELLKRGERLTTVLASTGVFSPLTVGMIDVGENTGYLEDIMFKTADYYDFDVQNSLSGLTTIIEPLLMCFMGIFVAVVLVAVFSPIYQLINQFVK